MKQEIKSFALFVAALALTGCATNTAMYNWGPYESQIYAHFKNESPEAQIVILEKHVQETQATGRRLPPGFRAHLGLLYSKVGREGDFLMALEQEKTAFPESVAYITNLLASTKSRREGRNEQK